MVWIVEVQHSSDTNLDGKWFELERVETEEHAEKLVTYFGTLKNRPKGIRPDRPHPITGSYAGRPVRKREI